MKVTITNASFGGALKAQALYEVVVAALERARRGAANGGHEHRRMTLPAA